MRAVQTFPNGPLLFEHCNKFGFEGVVSKRLSSRYLSGPSRTWQKSKCPNWKRINANRGKLFVRPKKPAMTEEERTLIRKRDARVQERLQDPDLRPGIARELRKHIEILEREIAELEQVQSVRG
jgi:hypothetical protein